MVWGDSLERAMLSAKSCLLFLHAVLVAALAVNRVAGLSCTNRH